MEGMTIDNIKIWKASHNKTRDYCEKWCNSCKECKSFSICNDSECLLRDYLVERSDLTKDSYVCTTYYRIQNGDNLQQSNGRNIENKGIYNRDIGGGKPNFCFIIFLICTVLPFIRTMAKRNC